MKRSQFAARATTTKDFTRPKVAIDATREVTLLAEKSLAVDWNRPEEDLAWAHLQMEKGLRCHTIH